MSRHFFPAAQFGRYLVVGVCNTLFAYGSYAGLTALLTNRVAGAYVVASMISIPVNITFTFLCYKWFVFKTVGNYLQEWLRCIVVYGSGSLVGTALLPLFVYALRGMGFGRSSPYVAGAALTAVTAMLSFLGHKKFSFAVRSTVLRS